MCIIVLDCSLCIRKWLGNKPHCPTCRKPAEPSQLVNNRVLDEIILALNRKSEDGTESSGEDCAIRSTVENISNSSSAAQCPVCLGSIGEAFLNSHLDLCLKKSQSSNNVSDRPKPLPKLAYNLLSDKQLKKILADQKISTKGKRNVCTHNVFYLNCYWRNF